MRVKIDGMHCDACVRRVRMALEKTEGVSVKEVQVGWAEVTADSSREPAMLEALRKAGFEPQKSQ
jgi:copper chaperone